MNKKLIALWLSFQALKAEINEEAAWIYYVTGYMDERKPISKRKAYVEAWYNHCRWIIQTTICHYAGHKWVDDSYGGPESGCMAGHCERCGYSFHNQLY